MDYLESIEPHSFSVNLGGKEYQIVRASLLTFWKLAKIAKKWKDDDEERLIVEYLSCALSVDPATIDEWPALDAFKTYEMLLALNMPQDIQYDHVTGPKNSKDNSRLDYDNQSLAAIVTRLASAFGWTRHYILNELTYDEARCYLQELAVVEHAEKEFEYALSEVAYDKNGRLRPLPPLPFALGPVTSENPPIPITSANRASDVGVAGVVVSAEDYLARANG